MLFVTFHSTPALCYDPSCHIFKSRLGWEPFSLTMMMTTSMLQTVTLAACDGPPGNYLCVWSRPGINQLRLPSLLPLNYLTATST